MTAVNPHGDGPIVNYPAILVEHAVPGPPTPRVPHARIDLRVRRGPALALGSVSGQIVLPSRMAVVRFGVHVLQLPLFSDLDLLLLEHGATSVVCVLPYPLLVSEADVTSYGVPSSDFSDLGSADRVRPAPRPVVLQGRGRPALLSAEDAQRMIDEGRTPSG